MTTVLAFLSTIFGAVNLYFIFAHVAGRQVPFVQTDRGVYILGIILALVMCSFGIQITLKAYGPKSFGMVTGAILGVILLIISIFVITGKEVPVIGSSRNALIVLGVFVITKWGIAVTQAITHAVKSS
jgi:hypothetical protein